MNDWIIAPVVLPALLAPLIVLTARFDLVLARVFSVAGTLALAGIALALLRAASDGETQVYALGDWPAPFGIVLVLDRLSALMLVLTSVLALVVLIHATGSGTDARGRHFHALFQFQLMGLNGAFLTGDAFNLFVFFEVLLIASYGLLTHGGGALRLRAGIGYVVVNLAGSALFLLALGTLYAVTGTLNMADMAQRVAALPAGDAALVRAGAMLLFLVFALKAALVPLHLWLPTAYAAAPAPVAALFAVMTKVGLYALLRFGALVFPAATPAIGPMLPVALMVAGLLGLVAGCVGTLGARDLPRLAGFAMIGSMGTLAVAVAPMTAAGIAAGLYYMLHTTLATALLFIVAGIVADRRSGDAAIAALALPQKGVLAALFMIAAVAMAGLPPLPGFLGKLLVLSATAQASGPGFPAAWTALWPMVWPVVWMTVLVTSLATMAAFARAGSTVFWTPPVGGPPRQTRRGTATAAAMPLLAAGALVALLAALTVAAGPVTRLLGATAAQLVDRGALIAAVLGAR